MDTGILDRLAANDADALTECVCYVCQWLAAKWSSIPLEDREEIASDTVFRAVLGQGNYRGDAKPVTWLLGIARNVVREYGRRSKRVPLASSLNDDNDDAVEIDSEVDVEGLVLNQMFAEEALEQLSPEQREAFLLTEREGLSSKEAAERMGKSPNAVRILRYRAMQNLGEYYRRNVGG